MIESKNATLRSRNVNTSLTRHKMTQNEMLPTAESEEQFFSEISDKINSRTDYIKRLMLLSAFYRGFFTCTSFCSNYISFRQT